jgi:2-amino-4-hydroxy-6-hydroxymethyldihydropteridine diphosphokinase
MVSDKSNIVYIALGSNKGDKLNFLRKAVERINNNERCCLEDSSYIYETKPFRNLNDENFLNAVIKISTGYLPRELFNFLKKVEKDLGRSKTEKWGDREIDLDILLYNDLIYSDNVITIPHLEMHKRDFVLIPLCEIAPRLVHPELKQKICDITVNDSEKCVLRKLPEKIITEEKIE